MAFSYSALKQYDVCPRQYYEVRVLKKHPRQETEQTIWGKQVHLACEEYIRDGKEFELEFPGMEAVRALARLPGEKHCEIELAVTNSLEPTDFNDPDALLRGIADLVILNGEAMKVLDYKTGNYKYPDTKQLELMALLLFAKYPQLQKSHGALLFLAHDHIEQKITKKEDAQRLWPEWIGRINRIEKALETDVWNAKPSGLCGWCPCTTCDHWKPKRR